MIWIPAANNRIAYSCRDKFRGKELKTCIALIAERERKIERGGREREIRRRREREGERKRQRVRKGV